MKLLEHLISNSKSSCISPYPHKKDVILGRAIEWIR